MKVVQALHNPAVGDAARAVQARKRTGVPAEQDDIRRIRTLHAIQIPWIRDNDAQAHWSRTLHRKYRAMAANANTTERWARY